MGPARNAALQALQCRDAGFANDAMLTCAELLFKRRQNRPNLARSTTEGVHMKPVDIEITYDFICPWCWIGHRNLKNALGREAEDVSAKLSYVPFELNPTMPRTGLDRREYRTAKFGSWSRSQAMDADVAGAGRKVGLEFNYDRIEVTPNTRRAHRLMAFAHRIGDERKTEALFESIFAAYFSRGENIGAPDVLVPLAEAIGFDAQQVRDFLSPALASEIAGTRISCRVRPFFRSRM
jgi:predicted DsbA family dithiol-disulfide isomerase